MFDKLPFLETDTCDQARDSRTNLDRLVCLGGPERLDFVDERPQFDPLRHDFRSAAPAVVRPVLGPLVAGDD